MENCVNGCYVHHRSHDQHLGGGVGFPACITDHMTRGGTASRGKGVCVQGKGGLHPVEGGQHPGGGVSIQGETGMHLGGLYLEGRVTSRLTEIYLYGIGHQTCPMEMFTYGDSSCQWHFPKKVGLSLHWITRSYWNRWWYDNLWKKQAGTW